MITITILQADLGRLLLQIDSLDTLLSLQITCMHPALTAPLRHELNPSFSPR